MIRDRWMIRKPVSGATVPERSRQADGQGQADNQETRRGKGITPGQGQKADVLSGGLT